MLFRLSVLLLSSAFVLAGASCDSHPKEVTKQLFSHGPGHGGKHKDDHGKDGHGADSHAKPGDHGAEHKKEGAKKDH